MDKRIVFTNTLAQLIGKIFSILVNLIIIHILAQHYSVSDVGEYTTVFSYLLIFNILADLGLSTIIVRDVHEYDEQKQPQFIGNVILIRSVSLIISLLIGVVIAQFIPQYNHIIKLGILIGSASTFFLLMATLLFSIFQIHLKLQKSVYANALGNACNIIFILLFIHFSLPIDTTILAVSLSYGIMFVIALIQVFKLQPIRLTFDKTIWKKVAEQSITVGGAIIFSTIYFKSDSVILSLLKPYSAVSLYGIPYKIIEVLIAFPQMFMAPVFTLMARQLKENNISRFHEMFQKAFNFLLLASFPIIPGAVFLSKKIILLYVGNQYLPSIDLLKILSLAVFVSFIGSSFIFVILVLKKQKYLLLWNIVLSFVNIILNILLIPKFSYFASAWLTVGTEALVFLGSVYFTHKSAQFIPSFMLIGKALLATIVFTAILYLFSSFNLFVQTLTACAGYALALVVLKAIRVQDIKAMILS